MKLFKTADVIDKNLKMKTFCIVLLAVFLQLNNAHRSINLDQNSKRTPSFIINGQNAKLGDLPHQLEIYASNETVLRSYCGAALISPTQALTAAHCVEGNLATDIKVYAGIVYRLNVKSSSGQSVDVKKIVRHPQYNASLDDYDIAVLTFKTPLKLNENVQPIAWNEDENVTFAGEKCVLSGWGQTNYGLSVVLKKVEMEIISNSKCNKMESIHPSNICAFELKYGACLGDSGSPMTCMHNGSPILAGVTSFGFSNPLTFQCNTRSPSVYTRVSFFKDFIQENLDNK